MTRSSNRQKGCRHNAMNNNNNVLTEINEETGTETLRFNVGGRLHEASWSIFKGKRGRVLPNFEELKRYYRPEKDDYYFDRHPGLFISILNYYRTGELHLPLEYCAPIVKIELDFWGISDDEIADCCWANYSEYQEKKEALVKFDSFLSKDVAEADGILSEWERKRSKVWRILENPTSCVLSKVYTFVSLFFVVLSILLFVLHQNPALEVHPSDPQWKEELFMFGINNETYTKLKQDYLRMVNDSSLDEANHAFALQHPSVKIINFMCSSFFILELVVRFVFCPQKCRFFIEPLNIIDILAILPFFIEFIFDTTNPTEALFENSVFEFVHILQIARIFRVFRLAKAYTGMRVILYSLKQSVPEVGLTVVILLITMLVFSSLMFYADNISNPASKFPDIPTTLWWAIVTLTTVGYGDTYPTSGPGYVIGSVTAFFGVLLLALTIPIIVSNFMLYYSYSKIRPRKRGRFRETKSLIFQNAEPNEPKILSVSLNGDAIPVTNITEGNACSANVKL